MRTIALEEHYWTPELAAVSGDQWMIGVLGDHFNDQLSDLGELRLKDMDEAGIDSGP